MGIGMSLFEETLYVIGNGRADQFIRD